MPSFMDQLLDQLETDAATALGLSADHVYRGRQARAVQKTGGAEVWLEPRTSRSEQQQLGQMLKLHEVVIHVRLRQVREGDRSGGDQVDTATNAKDTLRLRYDGTRLFYATLTDLVSLRCTDLEPDSDPTNLEVLDSALLLTCLER